MAATASHNTFDWLYRTAQMVHRLTVQRKPRFNNDARRNQVPPETDARWKALHCGGTVLANHLGWRLGLRPVRLPHGLKHLGERDAQRPCQPKQVLEGRIPASGFNPAQVRPVHLGQFRQALLGQPSLAERLPGRRRPINQRSELGFGVHP